VADKDVSTLNIQLPAKCHAVLAPKRRYKILRGGRGSAKSWSVARYLAVLAAFQKLRILCCREVQKTIRDSVYRLLKDQIEALELERYFTILKDSIRGTFSGSEFLFKGLRHDITEIKSTEGIDICWVEEAEKVKEDSWTILVPTIRKPDSEIIIVFNPEEEDSATSKRFLQDPPPNSISAEVNFVDNPWFPDVLRREMEYDRRVDFEKYEHVWMGKFKRYANALIFKGKIRVDDFETPDGVPFLFGADFGFSTDPTVLGRMFIREGRLFCDYEAYGVGVEIDELPSFFDTVPGSRQWEIIADSARPDTISYLQRHGFRIRGAEKGKGSVEDGIEFIRSFEEIVIHPRCRGAKDNFLNYKWKTDRITEAILPIPAAGSDHWCDAARYALERYIKAKVSVFDIDYTKLDLGLEKGKHSRPPSSIW